MPWLIFISISSEPSEPIVEVLRFRVRRPGALSWNVINAADHGLALDWAHSLTIARVPSELLGKMRAPQVGNGPETEFCNREAVEGSTLPWIFSALLGEVYTPNVRKRGRKFSSCSGHCRGPAISKFPRTGAMVLFIFYSMCPLES